MKRIEFSRMLAVFCILLGVFYFYLNTFAPRLIPASLRVGTVRKPLNLLIVGTDTTYNAETKKPIPELEGRADTIILAHIDPLKSRISALSIPRDTYLLIPGYGMQKINAANVYGSIPLVKETIANFTQQNIDYYIEIKPDAITKTIDLLGGISLYVEEDMRYYDRAQNLDINLKKGWQKLSGKKAQDYIRFRYDINGDIGRIERQQKFLKALTEAFRRPTNMIKAPLIIHAALKKVKTNLPLAQSIRLLNFARMASIKSSVASGEPSYITGAGSVWIPDKTAIEGMIKDYF